MRPLILLTLVGACPPPESPAPVPNEVWWDPISTGAWVQTVDGLPTRPLGGALSTGDGPLVRLSNGGRQFLPDGTRVPLALDDVQSLVWTPSGGRAWASALEGVTRTWTEADGVWTEADPIEGPAPVRSPHVLSDGTLLAAGLPPITSVDDGATWTPFGASDQWLACTDGVRFVLSDPTGLEVFTGLGEGVRLDLGAQLGCGISGDALLVVDEEASLVDVYDLAAGAFTGETHALPHSSRGWVATTGPDGEVWLSGHSGAQVWTEGDLSPAPTGPGGVWSGTVHDGQLVVGGSGALFRWDGDRWLHDYDGGETVDVDRRGDTWLGAWRHGLVEASTGAIWTTAEPFELRALSVAVGPDGTRYVGLTDRLVALSDAGTQEFSVATPWNIAAAADSRVWIATPRTISVLEAGEVRTVVEDPAVDPDAPLVALDGGDVLFETYEDLEFRVFRLSAGTSEPQALEHQFARSDHHGGAWLLNRDRDLTHMGADGTTELVGRSPTPEPDWLSWDGADRLAVSERGSTYFSLDRGFSWSQSVLDEGPMEWASDGSARSISTGAVYAPPR